MKTYKSVKAKQSAKKRGDEIQIEYEDKRIDGDGFLVNDRTVYLKKIDTEKDEPLKWEGKDWNENDAWVTCVNGTTSDVDFNEGFPEELKDVARDEVVRILRKFN